MVRFTGLTVLEGVGRELPSLLLRPPSRSTIRLFFFLRPRALPAPRWGDVGCETGEEFGEEWRGLLWAAATPLIVDGLPTATTGGEYATDGGREEVICSGGGEVRYRFS